MPSRVYFYKDPITGQKKRYHYCTLCSAGPFTEVDVNVKLFEFQGLRYCGICAYKLKLRRDNPYKAEDSIVEPVLDTSQTIIEEIEPTELDIQEIEEIIEVPKKSMSKKVGDKNTDDIELQKIDEVPDKSKPKKIDILPKRQSVDVTGLLSIDIVKIVKDRTSVEITNSLKDKESILRKAFKILNEHGIDMINNTVPKKVKVKEIKKEDEQVEATIEPVPSQPL